MIHAVLYLLFGIVSAVWLRFELRKNFSLSDNYGWLITAVAFGLVGSILSSIVGGKAGNLLLHSIGGGMAATCLYYYLAKNFGVKLNWRLNLAALFLFVCALGVLNELAEYFVEMVVGTVISSDTHDTWRDLVANTSGMLVLWGVVGAFLNNKKIHKPKA